LKGRRYVKNRCGSQYLCRFGVALPGPGHPPRLVHGGLLLMLEVADEADELSETLDVEDLEVDLVPATGGPGRLGPEPLDEPPLVALDGHQAWSAKSWATSCSPARAR